MANFKPRLVSFGLLKTIGFAGWAIKINDNKVMCLSRGVQCKACSFNGLCPQPEGVLIPRSSTITEEEIKRHGINVER